MDKAGHDEASVEPAMADSDGVKPETVESRSIDGANVPDGVDDAGLCWEGVR